MESIERLRLYARGHNSPNTTIADIDAIANAIERELAERYVELPTDIEDEPVHVGDLMTDGEYKFKVGGLAYYGGVTWSVLNDGQAAWAACDIHHHAPTVEDVLRKFADEVYADAALVPCDRDAIVARYLPKLREVMGDE